MGRRSRLIEVFFPTSANLSLIEYAERYHQNHPWLEFVGWDSRVVGRNGWQVTYKLVPGRWRKL